MASNLVIVESPAKAKTIEKFLGKDYKVASSFGHIADLPANELGVNVDGDILPRYIVSSDKKKVVSELKSLAKKMDTVWLASDEDREGEAIAWHLVAAAEMPEDNIKRVVFHGILHLCGYNDKTKEEIQLMRSKENECLEKYVSRET